MEIEKLSTTVDTMNAKAKSPPVLSTVSPMPCVVASVSNEPARAFQASDPTERLRLCLHATAGEPGSALAHLALASTYRETRDGAAAREALTRAAALAPDWEAVHSEGATRFSARRI